MSSSALNASELSKQYLSFMLSNEVYAVDILFIKEILEFGTLTRVPMMPDFLRGVINLRGAVVPVIDLSARFQTGVSEISKKSCIIIVETLTETGRQDLGIIVDAVNEVLDIHAKQLEPTPNFGTKIRTDFIEQMVKTETGFLIILNITNTLSMNEMSMLTAITNHSEPAMALSA